MEENRDQKQLTGSFGSRYHVRVMDFLRENTRFTEAQLNRMNVVPDPYVPDVYAFRIVPYRKEPTRYGIVYLNRTPPEVEEVDFQVWPPRSTDPTRSIGWLF